MPIEARGAKFPYAVVLGACIRKDRPGNTICFEWSRARLWLVADSDDEAAGKAVRAALRLFPQADLWRDHHHVLIPLAGVASISPLDIDALKPVPTQ